MKNLRSMRNRTLPDALAKLKASISDTDKTLEQATRDTLAMFYVADEFQHVAFLAEMEARKGRKLTEQELRDLGRLVAAYVNEQERIPEVGKGATILWLSDRHACTIIKVSTNRKEVTIRRDIATRTDKNGMSDSQEYDYQPDDNGAEGIYTLRRNGAYVKLGEPMRNGQRIAIGIRREFHDYSF